MKNLIYLVTLKPSSHRTAEESLGIQYLASSLVKSGFRVKVRDAWLDCSLDVSDVEREIVGDSEEVLFVGTSSYMLNNQPTCELISKLASRNIAVVSGGYGPTFEPEMFLTSGASIVTIGEGERTIVEIANFFKNSDVSLSEIDGIVYKDRNEIKVTKKRKLIENLDTLPYPQRPYLSIVRDRHSTVNVLSSRGCMGACTFCSISAFVGKQIGSRWRSRSIDNIIGELKELQKYGISTVKFIDDSLIENERDEEWCRQFAQAITDNGIKLNFRASIRADKVSEGIVKNLKNAGFFSYSCGIENGSPIALKRMCKLASLKDNENALKIFAKNGIYVQAGFILFDDKTTMQELKQNYNFLSKNISMVSKGIFSEMYAAVGTVFTKNANLENSEKYSSNNLYTVVDDDARSVYNYLKKWQGHHSKVYDMVIDPISAPKDIPVSEMKKYHKLMVVMKRIDLNFMKDLIISVDNDLNLDKLYNLYDLKYSNQFEKVEKIATQYYNQDGLRYDANINGFLKSNIQVNDLTQ